MEIQITEEKQNQMFGRKEIRGTINADVSPSREEVLKTLAEKFSSPVEAIKIKGIHGSFGSKTFNVEANIYGSREEKDSVEIKKKKEKEAEKKMEEATKVEEKPAEETSQEEKPAEESTKPAEPAPAQEQSEEKIEEQAREPERED